MSFILVITEILQETIPNILDLTKDKGQRSKDYKLLQEYAEVFPKEVLGLPPKRGIEFSINLIPQETLVSKSPYRMSTL